MITGPLPSGCLNGSIPVIGLWIVRRVRTQSSNPYDGPNTSRWTSLRGGNSTMPSNIPNPPILPFIKCNRNIPVKWIFVGEIPKDLLDKIWFSCHSNIPVTPHLFQKGISIIVMTPVATSPANRLNMTENKSICKSYLRTQASFLDQNKLIIFNLGCVRS